MAFRRDLLQFLSFISITNSAISLNILSKRKENIGSCPESSVSKTEHLRYILSIYIHFNTQLNQKLSRIRLDILKTDPDTITLSKTFIGLHNMNMCSRTCLY